MGLIKVSTCTQPMQRFEVKWNSPLSVVIKKGRLALDIGSRSGVDPYSGIHRYFLDEGKYAWMPFKERIIFNPAPTLFKAGVAEYYVDTMSAGHPYRLRGFAKFEGQLFV